MWACWHAHSENANMLTFVRVVFTLFTILASCAYMLPLPISAEDIRYEGEELFLGFCRYFLIKQSIKQSEILSRGWRKRRNHQSYLQFILWETWKPVPHVPIFLSEVEILHWLSHNFNLLEAPNKSEGIPTLSHPQASMIFLGNPSNSCWDISVWTKDISVWPPLPYLN